MQKGVCIPINMCKNSLAINAEIHRVQEDVCSICAVVGAAVRITDEMQKKLVDRPGSWKVLQVEFQVFATRTVRVFRTPETCGNLTVFQHVLHWWSKMVGGS